MSKHNITATAIAAALATLSIASPLTATAVDGQEKCFGIVKAGKNDCQGKANACSGHTLTDNEADAWLYVPTGSCDRVIGGSLFAGKGGSAGYNRKDSH